MKLTPFESFFDIYGATFPIGIFMIDVTKLKYDDGVICGEVDEYSRGWASDGNWRDGHHQYATKCSAGDSLGTICAIDAPLGYRAAILCGGGRMFVGVGKYGGCAVIPLDEFNAFSLFVEPSTAQPSGARAGPMHWRCAPTLHFVDSSHWAHQFMSEIDAFECGRDAHSVSLQHCRLDYYMCRGEIASRSCWTPIKIADGVFFRGNVVLTPPIVHLFATPLISDGNLLIDTARNLVAWVGDLKAPSTQLIASRSVAAERIPGLDLTGLPVELITLICAYVPRAGLVTDMSVTIYETDAAAGAISRYFHIPLGVPFACDDGIITLTECYRVLDPWAMTYSPLPVSKPTAEVDRFYVRDKCLGYVHAGVDYAGLYAGVTTIYATFIRHGFRIAACGSVTVCVKDGAFAICEGAYNDIL